ncbi:MAG: hypothetical protein WBB45_06285 [Cyclobacteriaceae bacterium]
MKKKFTLKTLNVTSFVTDYEKLTGGKPPASQTVCLDICIPSEWNGCTLTVCGE